MSAVAPLERFVAPPEFADVVGATPGRLADVARYHDMLLTANASLKLVGASTLDDFWSRHFVDSAQLLWFEREATVWADLGSGAGLPGIILAILLKGRPDARVHLVESMLKRCRFLSEVVVRLDLPATVHNARAESLKLSVDVVTARACAPLERLLGFSQSFFDRGARGLFLKGADVQSEIVAARKRWRFEPNLRDSLSDPRGRLVAIPRIAAAKPVVMTKRRTTCG